jgi:hypothetical protein
MDKVGLSNDPTTRAEQLRKSAATLRSDPPSDFALQLARMMDNEAALLDRGLHTVEGHRVVPFSRQA